VRFKGGRAGGTTSCGGGREFDEEGGGRRQGGMVVAPAMSYSPADSDKVIKFPSYADGNKTQLYDPAHCLELLSF